MSDILPVLEYMEKERGIPRVDMIATIVTAIKTAAMKGVNAGQELKIDINPKNGQLKAWAILRVVDSISDPKQEIHVEKAQALKANAQVGDVLEKEINPAELGRIAAQTARQAVMQKLRQFEKDRIYDDFKDMVGNIVTGTVRRKERDDYYVDLGKAEALLGRREQVPGEEYNAGDRVRCLLLSIDSSPRGPEIILTRASPKFVRRLFEVEVGEIADGTVKLELFAREPGYRSKMAVISTDPKVDPVGACVGAKGARVKSIVRELNNEKVDIIPFTTDIRQLVRDALGLKPEIRCDITVDERAKRLLLKIPTDALAGAIGKRGQNARLTSRLIGWKLDIEELKHESSDPRAVALRSLAGLGFEPALTERLVAIGITSPAAFEGVAQADLVDGGFTEEEAVTIMTRVSAST
jgi:transcription termination/antitermination protein NusA